MDLCHWSVIYERIRSPLVAGATLAQEYMFFLEISRRVPGEDLFFSDTESEWSLLSKGYLLRPCSLRRRKMRYFVLPKT